MIPHTQVAVDPPIQIFIRDGTGQRVELTAATPAEDRAMAHEARQAFAAALLARARRDERNAAAAAQRERAQRHMIAASRILLHVAASRPAARTAARAPRKAARRSTGSSSSSSDDPGPPDPPGARAAFQRIRAAQVALPTDPQLAARLIAQAAADLHGAA